MADAFAHKSLDTPLNYMYKYGRSVQRGYISRTGSTKADHTISRWPHCSYADPRDWRHSTPLRQYLICLEYVDAIHS